jgi:hypothetical protein
MGTNSPGKARKFLAYIGPEVVGGYRRTCDEIVAKGYAGVVFTPQSQAAPAERAAELPKPRSIARRSARGPLSRAA